MFGLKSVHGFVILVGKIKFVACLVFYLVIKMRENLCKKPYQTWKTVVEIFKKHINVPTGTQKKKQISFHKFLGEYTLFLLPLFLLCLKREIKNWVNWENWVRGGRRGDQFFKKPSGRKGKGERKYKICRSDGMFLF